MSNPDFKVWQSADNKIEFCIRTPDRKPINLLDKFLVANILNPYNHTVLMQRHLRVTDPINGRAELVFYPQDTVQWDPGYYTYSILVLKTDEYGQQAELLYLDENSNCVGNFELATGAMPFNSEAYEVRDHWEPFNSQFDNSGTHWKRSSAFPGNLQNNAPNAIHTFVIYPKGFHGLIKVQASLAKVPNIDLDWFDIKVMVNESGVYIDGHQEKIEAFNFIVNAEWVRFLYRNEPFQNKFTYDDYTHGLPPRRILYKNSGYARNMKIIDLKTPEALRGQQLKIDYLPTFDGQTYYSEGYSRSDSEED